MANFSKYKKATISQKQTVPSKIYESLDRKSEAGPLRPTQDRILTEWYSNRRQDRDIIIKLPTGSGKTLIGLLIGLSKAKPLRRRLHIYQWAAHIIFPRPSL